MFTSHPSAPRSTLALLGYSPNQLCQRAGPVANWATCRRAAASSGKWILRPNAFACSARCPWPHEFDMSEKQTPLYFSKLIHMFSYGGKWQSNKWRVFRWWHPSSTYPTCSVILHVAPRKSKKKWGSDCKQSWQQDVQVAKKSRSHHAIDNLESDKQCDIKFHKAPAPEWSEFVH